jgi:transglutaminase-like putative cysteine protease
MEKSRPQLNLSELHQVRWLLGGVIGLLSAWTVFYLEADALLALAGLTLVVPVFIWKPWLARALPPLFHRLAFPVVVSIFAFDLWANREPLPAMIRLSLLLLGYRCVSPRGRREDLQVILLALFLVVVTGVFTVSPVFVVQILFFTAAALGLLLAVTLSDARAGGMAAEAVTGWERVGWRDLFGRLRGAVDLRVVGLFGLLFTGVVGLSILLFLALPRFELSNSLFLDRMMTRQSRSGFSEDVRFGELVDIAQDGSMAFAVDVSDLGAVPADPYWRMLVLDEYSGSGFRVSSALRAAFGRTSDLATTHVGSGRVPRDGAVWTVYFQPGVSRYLPLPGAFGRMTFAEAQVLTLSRDLRLAALQREPAKMLAFKLEGVEAGEWLADAAFAREKRQLPAESRRWRTGADVDPEVAMQAMGEVEDLVRQQEDLRFLNLEALSEGDRARLAEWVAQLGGVGEGGADFGRRAKGWLQERHGYSLQSRMPETGGEDVLVRWMGSTEPGHCELFAGGLVLLARSAGVPARLVTGFRGGVWNGTSGHITVKNSDAHAWVEVWDEARGAWWRVDPTPGGAVAPQSGTEAEPAVSGAQALQEDEGWGARMDGLRVFWYRRIVNFDQGAQTELLRSAKDRLKTGLDGARERLEEALREGLAWLRQPWGAGRVALTFGWMLAGAGLVWWWRRSGRGWLLAWRSRRASAHRGDPVRREASRWLRKLAAARPAEGSVQAEREAARAELLRLRYGAREGRPSPAAVFGRARVACRDRR